MSDDYLPLLMAHMQKAIADLTLRVEALEAIPEDEDDEAHAFYMDGSPVR